MASRADLAREFARPVVAFANRRQAPRKLAASSLFDEEWVSHQLGRTFSTRVDAVTAYLAAKAPDLSPHPLFQSDWFDPKRTWHQHRYADPLSLYLSRAELRRSRSPHPLFDTGAYLAVAPEAAEHPDGPLGHWLAAGGDELPVPPGTPAVSWRALRARLFDASTTRPEPTDVTVVLEANWDSANTQRQIRAALAGDSTRSIVVVGPGIDRSHRALIVSLGVAWPNVQLTQTRPAEAGVVVDVHPDCVPLDDAVDQVVAALGGTVVVAQAVGVDQTGVIAAAGVVDGTPFLHGLLEADAEVLGTVPVDSVDGTLVARRAGADHGDAVLVGTAIAITPAEHVFPQNQRGLDTAAARPAQPTEGLRWSLDIAAPADEVGRVWGDYYFARSLQAALRAEGQHAGIQYRDGRNRASLALDDVVLTLRGETRSRPQPGALNILWVIYNPRDVTREEAAEYDLVFAASTTWARRKSEEWGLRISPLLQATDPTLFHPGLRNAAHEVDGEPAPDLLFLGNSRQEYRRGVRLAVEAGLDVTVIGNDWTRFLGPGVARPGVPNALVGPLYANSGIVLNDHWDDMRSDGFISNRAFDALACGARLLSDDVAGMHEVFGDAVATFTDAASMAEIVRNRDRYFASDAEREANAVDIVEQHSFSARARELVAAAREAQSRP